MQQVGSDPHLYSSPEMMTAFDHSDTVMIASATWCWWKSIWDLHILNKAGVLVLFTNKLAALSRQRQIFWLKPITNVPKSCSMIGVDVREHDEIIRKSWRWYGEVAEKTFRYQLYECICSYAFKLAPMYCTIINWPCWSLHASNYLSWKFHNL